MKRIKITAVIAVLTALFLFSCKNTSTGPNFCEAEKLMPGSNEVAGWIVDPETECFKGIAKTADALFPIINGGADVYLDRGFISGSFDGYTDGNKSLCVQIYEQKNSDSALSVFSYCYEFVINQAENITLGDTAVFDVGYTSDLELLLSTQRFFIRLSVNSKEENYKNALISFGQKIVDKTARYQP